MRGAGRAGLVLAGAAAAAAALAVLAAVAQPAAVARAAAAPGPTDAQRVAIMRGILDEGLQCIFERKVLARLDGLRAKGTIVTATISGYSEAFKKRIAIDVEFVVNSIADVHADNAAAQRILDCARTDTCRLPKLKAGLAAKGGGAPALPRGVSGGFATVAVVARA